MTGLNKLRDRVLSTVGPAIFETAGSAQVGYDAERVPIIVVGPDVYFERGDDLNVIRTEDRGQALRHRLGRINDDGSVAWLGERDRPKPRLG